jgi:type III secretory pathway component EscT
MKALNVIIAYLLAVLVTYILGAIFVSQGNIARVIDMGFDITMSHRLDAMLHDVTHMYDIYLPVIAIAMLIALPVAAGIIRFTPNLRLIGYVAAGFVAMIAIHMILKAVLGLTGIAPTRDIIGLLGQGVAGAIGGYAYHVLSRRTAPQTP